MRDRLIATINTSSWTWLTIELTQAKNRRLLDVREYVFDEDAVPTPTGQGIACKLALLPDLIEALRRAEAEARRLKLLK